MASPQKVAVKFKARGGTGGAAGQMYESKLLSLVGFRLAHDPSVADFWLASNVNDVGDLDDVCLRFALAGRNVAVFVQAKHVDDPGKGITASKLYNHKDKFYLNKYFDSYIEIRKKFEAGPPDLIFRDAFADIDFYFIFYTPIANKIDRKKDIASNPWFDKVKDVLSSSKDAETHMLAYNSEDIRALSEPLIKERIESIGKAVADFFLSPPKKEPKITAFFEKYYELVVPEIVVLSALANRYEATVNCARAADSSVEQLKQVVYRETLKTVQNNAEDVIAAFDLLLNGDTSLISNLIGVLHYDQEHDKLILNPKSTDDIKRKFEDAINKCEVTEDIKSAINTARQEKVEGFKVSIAASIINKIRDSCQNLNETDDNSSSSLQRELDHYKVMAKHFFENLYFFTKQGKEHQVGQALEREIESRPEYKANYGIQAQSFCLHYHEEVQKWWIKQGSKHFYNKEYVSSMLRKIPLDNYIDMLDFISKYEIKQCAIMFNDEAVAGLRNQVDLVKITNITTESTILTSVKLYQEFKETGVFVNLDPIAKFKPEEMKIFKEQRNRNIAKKVFIIIINETNYNVEVLMDIVESVTKDFIIVSKEKVVLRDKSVVEARDAMRGLSALEPRARARILAAPARAQGVVAPLAHILDDTTQHFLNVDVITKILKNEQIAFGKQLTNMVYEDMKDIYIPRVLVNERIRDNYIFYPVEQRWSYDLETFKDTENNVYVITAKPGMGKSTTLTHLSLATKVEYPNIWIVRMNLLDYSDHFRTWEKEKTKINLRESIMFTLNSELPSTCRNAFDIQVDNEHVTITNCQLKGVDLLHLELLVHCYNSGDIIFLFDGFDEICPIYQNVVGKFIYVVMKLKTELLEAESEQGEEARGEEERDESAGGEEAGGGAGTCQAWITCRPYNQILQYLEDIFGDVLSLDSFTKHQQKTFYEKFWNTKIVFERLKDEQLANIESFFDYMSQFGIDSSLNYRTKTLPLTVVPLKYMYIIAVEYFRSQILKAPIAINKEELLNKWISRKVIIDHNAYVNVEDSMELVGVPLHMHITASLFASQVNEQRALAPPEWDLERQTGSFMERYLVIKLKYIKLADKDGLPPSRPGALDVYTRERAYFLDMHKKMAFYSMFRYSDKILQTFLNNEIKIVENDIHKIGKAEERTGLIDHVRKGTPRFVHLTFAEYFCVEFIVDLLTASRINVSITINFIVNHLLLYGTIGLRNAFDQKIKYDSKLYNELTSVEAKRLMFDLLTMQNVESLSELSIWEKEGAAEYERTNEDALSKAIDNRLLNVVLLLVRSAEEALAAHNADHFLAFLGRGFFVGLALLDQHEPIAIVLNKVRQVDPSKINSIISICELNSNINEFSTNDEILEALKIETTAMRDAPYYYDFDAEHMNDMLL